MPRVALALVFCLGAVYAAVLRAAPPHLALAHAPTSRSNDAESRLVPPESDPYEPNDDPGNAARVESGHHRGLISPAGDLDFFTLYGTEGNNVLISIDAADSGSMLDSIVDLFDPAGILLASGDDQDGTTDSRILTTLPETGWYIVSVQDKAHQGGSSFFYGIDILGFVDPRRAVIRNLAMTASGERGTSVTVVASVRNTGDVPWTSDERFRLGEHTTESRIELPAEGCPPGSEVQISGSFELPEQPGLIDLSWQMLQENSRWFGNLYPHRLEVRRLPRGAIFETDNLPVSFEPGERFPVVINVFNDSRMTWSEEEQFRVGDLLTERRLRLSAGVTVPEAATAEFRGPFTAPGIEGEVEMRWRMVQDGATWFGPEFPRAVSVRFTGRGDVDGSGGVTPVDARALIDHLLGNNNLTAEQQARADANGDGCIDVCDLIWINHTVANLGLAESASVDLSCPAESSPSPG